MKNDMVDLLLNEPVGVIMACNIVKSSHEKLIKNNELKEFMGNALDAFIEDRVKTTAELVAQLSDVASGMRPIGGKRRQFYFACGKRVGNMSKGKFSTILSVSTLKKRLVLDPDLDIAHKAFVSNHDPLDPALEDAIGKLNGRPSIYRPNAKLGGSPNRPLFWITPSDNISKKRLRYRTYTALGNTIRDLLGLIHYKKGVPLVEIRIHGSKLQSLRHARPTFADAGGHRRFKIYTSSGRAKKKPAWGWTVDLHPFHLSGFSVDGAEERVVESACLGANLETEFQFCGFTDTTRGNTAKDNDAEFADRLLSDLTTLGLTYLRDELLRLFP
ncbi:MAG: hypothetical protein HQL05_03385 [Nitrospirae bacterium]|uniref:hypothetical protein n=1 Tax=Candidatus Magnetobacterium casense TaxID=1455061 RepID=UPI00058B1CCF|nr:hypothetical protein [Candidatus Magnetobacterium casensis]MBF0336851.1 hypothetical protein [Nitrospirota bacterium]